MYRGVTLIRALVRNLRTWPAMPREKAQAEQRGQVIDVEIEPTGNRRSSIFQRKAATFNRWHEPDKSRGLRPDL